MSFNLKNIIKRLVVGAIVGLGIHFAPAVSAIGNGLTVSPMIQSIIVNPGESQQGTFVISNPSSATQNLYYALSVEPFYTSEDGSVSYEAKGNMNDIVNWISFDVPTEGQIEPNEAKNVIFTINVPETAPAGGQYFTIMVTETDAPKTESDEKSSDDNDRHAVIKEIYRMAHLVYAEVTGNVIKKGEITDVALPNILLSGNITGSASVKNTGNVHGNASYTMQVFPLFSDEEIYTNEEKPETVIILPDRTVYHETSWDATPAVGIFNVIYTVQFGDSTEQISRMVIKCPIWLLFIVVFVIIAIIIYFVVRAKSRKRRVE